MSEIAFFGLPNVGKSTLINALAGAHLRTGNQNGVTVSTESVGMNGMTLTDLPGLYSAHPISNEEGVTLEYVRSRADAYYIFVVETAKLPSALALLPLLSGRRGMIVLTMYRSFKKRGGEVRIERLSARLGVPVVATDAYSRREVSALRERMKSGEWGTFSSRQVSLTDVYFPPQTAKSHADRLFFNPFFCILFFIIAFVGVFYLTFAERSPGVLGKDLLQDLLCVRLVRLLEPLFRSEIIRSLAVDGILTPMGNVLSFLPQIAMLYLFLQLLEESGILSAFAFCADPLLKKLSVGGKGLFCLLIGFGCTTQGIEMARGIPSPSDKKRVLAALPYFSCSAKLPVYVTLLSAFFENPFPAVLLLYLLGVGIGCLVCLFLSDRQGEDIAEIPRFHLPAIFPLLRTLVFRLKGFIYKVGKVVAVFSVAVWFLSSFDFSLNYVGMEESMLARLCGWGRLIFFPLGVRDWQTAFALFSGIAAKENIAGLLVLFYPEALPYSPHTAFALSVFILLSPPCISAIGAQIRQLGGKRTFRMTAVGFFFAWAVSACVYFISEVLF